jgi:hypothetical protein
MKAELIEAARACGLPVRVYATPPPPPVVEHEACNDLLIAAGWGDVEKPYIPVDVLRDAQHGRKPRRNEAVSETDARRNRSGRKPAAALPALICAVCQQSYRPKNKKQSKTCSEDCRAEITRRYYRAWWHRTHRGTSTPGPRGAR